VVEVGGVVGVVGEVVVVVVVVTDGLGSTTTGSSLPNR